MTRPRRAIRYRPSLALLAVPVVAAVAGGLLIFNGSSSLYPAMPLPERTFSASTVAGSMPQGSPSALIVSAPYPDKEKLYIPSIGVVASFVPEASNNGSLVIPGDPKTVGMFNGNPGVEAQMGTTLLAGHVTFNSVAGALLPLHSVARDALIVTTDSQGRAWAWRVVGLEVVPRAGILPLFPKTGARRLVVVTCGGKVESTSAGLVYESNVIVTAIPA